ncbi:MAG: heme exporter protein CcmD [Gammaproteobacteria bacterium]|nr:heme exporter protein CcmD [Azohydromonas sp.]
MDWHWDSFADFVAMGGYGLYVWGSYGMLVLVLGAELWALRVRRKALAQEIDE